MSQRNSSQGQSLPYAGLATLALATFAAGAVLAAVPWSRSLLNTWYLTRAAGMVAYLLLWLSVVVGLLQSTAFLKGATSPLANIDIHQYVSVGALYATTFHAVVLGWDRFVPFSVLEILVPFTSDYKRVLTALGGLALYVMIGVTVTTYLRGKLSPKLWRAIHLSSLGGFAFALLHGWMMGTDSASPIVSFMYRFTGLSILVLTGWRFYRARAEVKQRANSAGGR